jgi:predicted XRE-type DNA-binding protein
MANALKKIMVADEIIVNKIYQLRQQKIMLDKDLAELYGVTTGNLNKAVKRNLQRFPDDFMFQLTEVEFKNLIFQTGISSWGWYKKNACCFYRTGRCHVVRCFK